MSAQSLAELLNGREYGKEITADEEAAAKAAGLVVVFGYSDDNMEFRGAIHDEVGCYGGGEAFITPDGLLTNDCDDDDCPHFKRLKNRAAVIEADDDGDGWTYATEIPHHTFDIIEDGRLYCRGIVFALADVPKVAA